MALVPPGPGNEDLFARKIHRVRLDQYAGACAALAEGFALPDVLANDALDDKTWRLAGPAWAMKLARETPGSPLKSAYEAKLAEAVAWLGRRVEPLEDDLSSWLGFLGAWSRDPAPDALLYRLELRSSDIARLQRAWETKRNADTELDERATKLSAKKPSKLPALRVTPARLRPFPWSVRPPEPAPVIAPKPVETPAVPEGPLPEIAVVTPSFLREPGARMGAMPSFLSGAVAEKGGLDKGAAAQALVEPFPKEAPKPALAEPKPALVAAKAPVGETAMAFEIPRGPATPFAAAKSESPLAKPSPDAAHEKAPSPMSGETALVFELPKGLSLPFAGAASKGSTPIGQTVDAFELPRDMVLPFAGSSSPASSSAPVSSASPAPAPAAKPAAAPPALTIEQHASLSAELALSPARAAEILQRYRLTPETRQKLDRHYAELGAARPEVHAAWERAYRTYYQWLLTQPRPGVKCP